MTKVYLKAFVAILVTAALGPFFLLGLVAGAIIMRVWQWCVR